MCSETVIGIDVSRDWLDGFCLPEKQRFRFQNSPDGHARLLEILQSMPDGLKVAFEATGGQEWALWRVLISMGLNAVQLPPAQIKAFALSIGETRENRSDRCGIDCALYGFSYRSRTNTAGCKTPVSAGTDGAQSSDGGGT